SKVEVNGLPSPGGTVPVPAPVPVPPVPLSAPADEATRDVIRSLTLQTSCVSCHAGAAPKGGLDLSAGWVSLQPDVRKRVYERLSIGDPAKGMPRDKSGKHVPLPKFQVEAFRQ